MEIENGRLLRNKNRMALLGIDQLPARNLRARTIMLTPRHRDWQTGDKEKSGETAPRLCRSAEVRLLHLHDESPEPIIRR